MRALIAGSMLVVTGQAFAQNAARPDSQVAAPWSFNASAFANFIPDDHDYVQPTFTADHDWLHLEGRYNYEDMETATLWAGYNVAGGDDVAWEITPILGIVLGNTTGVAPGYRGSLSWWKLELYSEGEYVFNSDDSSDSFFYNWSELALLPLKHLRLGVVTQRTRAYQAERDIQRGFFAGFTYRVVSLTTYVLNPDQDKPIVALSVAISF